ncbi:hypothetical protein V6N11_080457 [Hibiscus sabdariffa]|uniref:Uncharacterized protein n=1 Tax=Hibiscus sabdariffa TaxID=183260 RepID=A0ABR2R7S2_9ROSI
MLGITEGVDKRSCMTMASPSSNTQDMLYPCAIISKDIHQEKYVPFEKKKKDKKKAQTRLEKLKSHGNSLKKQLLFVIMSTHLCQLFSEDYMDKLIHEDFNASVGMIVEWEFINHVSLLSDLDISVTQLASRKEVLR